MLSGLIVLLGFQLIGEVLVQSFALPVPGPVIGMALLFGVLVAWREVPETLRRTADGLLRHFMLLLVPATLGLMLHLERLQQEWLPIVLAGVGGTAVTLAATGLTLHVLVLRRRKDPR